MKAKLVLIVCLYAAFFILTPPFQLPDEPDHYQYIFLLSRRSYPRLIPNASTPGNQKILQVMEQVHDYTKVASRDYALPDYRKIAAYVSRGDRSRAFSVSRPALSKQGHQPPLYHIIGAGFFSAAGVLGSDIMTQFYAVRFTSALFYFLSAYLAYRLFRLVLRKRQSAENLTVFFALNPLVVKMGITVNPDIALLFSCLLFLYLLVNALIRKKDYPPLFLAFIAGLSVLIKFQGVFLIPVYIGYLLLRRVSRQQFLLSMTVFLSGILAVILPWLMLNLRTYGTPMVDNFAVMCKQDQPQYPVLSALFQAAFEFRHTAMHYAGFWGWGEPYPFKPFFLVYAAGLLICVAAGMAIALRKKNTLLLLLAGFIISLLLFLFPVSLRHKLMRYSCDIQGRYLLPVFPALTLIGLTGPVHLFRAKEEPVSRFLMLFAIFQAQLVLWYVVIPKYYV